MFRILHFSDLHISNPENDPEVLRNAFYDEYINGMTKQIELEGIPSIDCMIVSGDFIHQGNVANYEHALKIIEYFAQELSLQYERIVMCVGNHDIIRYHENNSKYYNARKDYLIFSSCFANGYGQSISKRAQLMKISEKIFAVSIDSTLNAPETGMPGMINTNDIDLILNSVKEIGKDNILLLCSHFPPIPQLLEPDPFDQGDTDWYSKHIWTMAFELTHRLKELRKPYSTLWFSGDVHKDYQLNIDENYYITTGRFGTNDQQHSNFRRQAKIIELDNEDGENKTPKIYQIEYNPIGHNNKNLGKWRIFEQNFQKTSTYRRSLSDSVAKPDKLPVEPEVTINNEENLRIHLIDDSLENLIYKTIVQKKLYIWGRYRTWNNLVSLSWIPIGPLVNTGDLLSAIVYNTSNYIVDTLLSGIEETEINEKVIILGADCWGAVLSSQISVATGISNIVFGSRSGGEHCSKYETIDNDAAEIISHCEHLIFISDVVATGQSLKSTYKHLRKIIGKDDFVKISWHSISIICDENKTNKVDLSFLSSISTACCKIEMPIIKSSDLPTEQILPSDIVWE